MKILLIGFGRWGKNHFRTLMSLADEIYVVDSDENQLKDLPFYSDHISTDYADFLDKVDAVVVSTSTESHVRICMECFEKQKDVFVEKPIALTSKGAMKMINQADKYGLILQVGHIYRYHPASSKIKKIIEEGRLGTIKYAYGHFMGFKRPRTDVGVTQTDAIHFFDLFNYLFDDRPNAVTGVVKSYLNLPLDDTSVSILDYHGKIVVIEAGYMAPEEKRDIGIVGDMGSLHCDFRGNHLLFCNDRHEMKENTCVAIEGSVEVVPVKHEEALTIELRAFLDSVKTRSKPLADGNAGYEALKIVEACYESSKKGRRIEIEW
jgi:predicted dehydrogenase